MTFPLAVWALSRVFFLVVGEVAAHTLHHVSPGTDVLGPGGALDAWARWDGAWYAGIALHGYEDFHAPASANFFPLFPLLVRVGTWIGLGLVAPVHRRIGEGLAVAEGDVDPAIAVLAAGFEQNDTGCGVFGKSHCHDAAG